MVGHPSNSWASCSRWQLPPSWLFNFQKFYWLLESRGPRYITVPSFVKIGQSVAELWRLFNFLTWQPVLCHFPHAATSPRNHFRTFSLTDKLMSSQNVPPCQNGPTLSSQNGPHTLQVLIVFTGPTVLLNFICMHIYHMGIMSITWYVLLLKEEVTKVNRLGAILTLPGSLCLEAVLVWLVIDKLHFT